ncbi:MAG: DUF349 domain-containing protein [Cytophagaceae bacterium]|nr:DUF349 domain-containing protein [Cytophagaceae bacterium]
MYLKNTRIRSTINLKQLCDQYFDLKRNKNKAQDSEYDSNLAAKVAICVEVEKAAADGNSELSKLSDYKKICGHWICAPLQICRRFSQDL